MLAKLTSKNQLTLPKAIVQQVNAEYFEVSLENWRVILTPVKMQRGRCACVRRRASFATAFAGCAHPRSGGLSAPDSGCFLKARQALAPACGMNAPDALTMNRAAIRQR